MISKASATRIGCSLIVLIVLALVSYWLEMNVIQLAITLVLIYKLLIKKEMRKIS